MNLYIATSKQRYKVDLSDLTVRLYEPEPAAAGSGDEHAVTITINKDAAPELKGNQAFKLAMLIYDTTYDCGELFSFNFDPARAGSTVRDRHIEIEDQRGLRNAVKRVKTLLEAWDIEYLVVQDLGEVVDKIPFQVYEADGEPKKEAA